MLKQVSIVGRSKKFVFILISVSTDSGALKASFSVGTGGLFPRE